MTPHPSYDRHNVEADIDFPTDLREVARIEIETMQDVPSMVYDPKEHFDETYITFFEGVPEAKKVKPGELGVNIDLFRQVKIHYRKSRENVACRVLADLCQDIQGSGYVGGLEDSALRVGTTIVTVQRWRARFAEGKLLVPHNRNGLYSVDPKVAIKKDSKGNIIKPKARNNDVFTF